MAEHSPRHLILSLFGLYARDGAHWLSVRSLIELMADLDVDASATRSSVSRLKKRGVLEPAKVDGQAGYRLSASALAVLREGDSAHLVAAASLGRGRVADGGLLRPRGRARQAARAAVAAHPARVSAPRPPASGSPRARPTTRRWPRSTAPGSRPTPSCSAAPTSAPVRPTCASREWWDLPAIAALYDEFVADHGTLTRLGSPDPARAFTAYVPMLTAWRRLPYLDPGIPLELLPAGWPGVHAADLFAELDARLREPAAKHARARLGT